MLLKKQAYLNLLKFMYISEYSSVFCRQTLCLWWITIKLIRLYFDKQTATSESISTANRVAIHELSLKLMACKI